MDSIATMVINISFFSRLAGFEVILCLRFFNATSKDTSTWVGWSR